MAKFKVGDTAFVFDDWDSPYDGRGGKVVKVDRYVHIKFPDGNVAQFAEDELTKTANAARSRNAVVQKALNATGDRRDYYVVDEFGNAADGSKTPLPFDRASKLFLKLTGSKSGNGKWGIIRRGESASRARDWYGNIVSWNADTSVLRETAVNGAGYVDASTVVIRPGDAVVFKTGYRSHSNDDDWLERNGDTVREVRGDEVKIGPSANDWAKIKDLMVWHNSRSTNAVVAKALNASHKRRS